MTTSGPGVCKRHRYHCRSSSRATIPPARRLTAAETALSLGDFLGHTDRYSDAAELLDIAGRDGFAGASLERLSLIELRRGDFAKAHRDADEAWRSIRHSWRRTTLAVQQ